MVTLDAEVLCQVDDLHMLGDGVLLQESFTLPMPEAEEYDVDILKRHRVSELEVGFPNQSFMNIAYQIPRITLGIGKHNLCLRVVQKQTDKLSARVACGTEDAY